MSALSKHTPAVVDLLNHFFHAVSICKPKVVMLRLPTILLIMSTFCEDTGAKLHLLNHILILMSSFSKLTTAVLHLLDPLSC